MTAGERVSVILITHDKLPRGKYMIEKEDGTGQIQDHYIMLMFDISFTVTIRTYCNAYV